MAFDSTRPPQTVLSAMCRLVDLIDQKLLWAHAPKKYFHGHRPIPKNAAVVQKCLRLDVQHTGGPDDQAKQFLRLAPAPEVGAVPQLSEQFISRNLTHLSNFYGRPELLAACWLDDRDPVRKLVFSQSEEWLCGEVSEDERKGAAECLSIEFGFVRGILASAEINFGDASGVTCGVESSVGDEVAKTLLKSQRENEILEGKYQRKISKLQTIIENTNVKLRDLHASAATRREREKTLLDENQKLQGKLEAFEQALETRIRLEVSERFEQEACRWLWHPRLVEAKIAESDAEDLTTRAKRLLDRQRVHDRHYGNGQELREKIDQRRELLQQLEHAQANSLRPLPELNTTIAALKRDIDCLSFVLEGSVSKCGELVSSLVARINGVQSLSDLDLQREFHKDAYSFALLSAADRDLLDRALDATHERLLILFIGPDTDTPAAANQCKHPLLDAVRSGRHFFLFLDGHNILHRLRDAFGAFFDHEQPGVRARNRLAELVVESFRGTSVEVALYYDSSEPSIEIRAEYVKLIYSGGEGRNRADFAILEDLEERRRAFPKSRIVLVTTDLLLAKEANREGVETLTSEDFGWLFLGSASHGAEV